MKKHLLINLLILCALFENSAQQLSISNLAGSYLGQSIPGLVPEVFASGIVSKEGVQSKLIVSPNMSEIIFKTMLVTPEQGSTPASRLMYFESITFKNGKWDQAIILPFSRDFINDEPALSSDGNMLFFVSNRPKEGTIEAQKMPDIWVSSKTLDGWGTPKNIGSPVNTDNVEVQPFFSSDNKLYFGRMDGIYSSQYADGKFSEPIRLAEEIFQGRVRGICISPDNKVLILHSDRPGGFGGWDLYCSFKGKDEKWTNLLNLGNNVNTDKSEANATFSPDGKFIFFSRGDDILWVSAKILDSLKTNQ